MTAEETNIKEVNLPRVQEEETEAQRILKAEYGVLSPFIDQEGPTRRLTTEEGRQELEEDIKRYHGQIVETLKAAGVEVREAEPRSGVPIRESAVSRYLGPEDPNWDAYLKMRERDRRSGWTRLYRDAGLIGPDEALVTTMGTVRTRHPKETIYEEGQERFVRRDDEETGWAKVENYNLRRLVETALRHPKQYLVIDGYACFTGSKTAEIHPGADPTSGILALVQKLEPTVTSTTTPAPKA